MRKLALKFMKEDSLLVQTNHVPDNAPKERTITLSPVLDGLRVSVSC